MIIEWIIIFIIILMILRVKIRGFFWEDKRGHKLSLKEFLSLWGKGIKGITPLQQAKTTLLGLWITITGIISGIIINLLVRITHQWLWITVILCGSLIITLMSFVGAYQKYNTLKLLNEKMRSLPRRING